MPKREHLGSRLGFILLSAGCAIGIGNVWKFPWMAGQYGGGAFVAIYLIFLMILGVPVFAVIIELIKRAVDQKLIAQNKETDTTYYYRKNAIGNAEEEVYYEHAHWRYKYDHSKIKPHVDKMLAALVRTGKKKKKTDEAEGAPKTDAPVGETDVNETPVDTNTEE